MASLAMKHILPHTKAARAVTRKDRDAKLQFPVYIRAARHDLGSDDRTYIRRKLATRLRKFARSIQRVSVRIKDVNGPRGGVDQMCRIKVVLSGLPSILFESRAASLRVAIDRALDGTERAVRRAVQRRRMKPLRRNV